MPNYGLFTNFVFHRFSSKKEKISVRKKRKRTIAAVSVATEFYVSRKTFKQMAKEICHNNISYIATQRIEYRREAISRQKIVCRDRKWKNVTSQLRQRTLMLQQGLSTGCQHQEVSVAT